MLPIPVCNANFPLFAPNVASSGLSKKSRRTVGLPDSSATAVTDELELQLCLTWWGGGVDASEGALVVAKSRV